MAGPSGGPALTWISTNHRLLDGSIRRGRSLPVRTDPQQLTRRTVFYGPLGVYPDVSSPALAGSMCRGRRTLAGLPIGLAPVAAPQFGPAIGPRRMAARGSLGNAHGFSLLELIVATALLAIAVVGLLSLASGALANAALVREYDRAAMLARTTMNELLVEDGLPLGATLSGRYGEDSGWAARLEPFELPLRPTSGRSMLVRIQLDVWWRSQGRRKTVSLEGFRRMIIRPEQGLDVAEP